MLRVHLQRLLTSHNNVCRPTYIGVGWAVSLNYPVAVRWRTTWLSVACSRQ